MYMIMVKFPVQPASADDWPAIVEEFTQATRAEAGNIFFQWSRCVDNPNEYVLVEAFTDEGGPVHVASEHFAKGMESMRPHLSATPKILSRQVEGEGWEAMGELSID